MKFELKPCPFCGGQARVTGQLFQDMILYYTICDHCRAETKKQATMQEAADAWNRRTDCSKMQELIKRTERAAKMNAIRARKYRRAIKKACEMLHIYAFIHNHRSEAAGWTIQRWEREIMKDD